MYMFLHNVRIALKEDFCSEFRYCFPSTESICIITEYSQG